MDKKKLQAAIAPFPIKQSDKERFVNTITEMSSSGGGGVEYEYYKIDYTYAENIGDIIKDIIIVSLYCNVIELITYAFSHKYNKILATPLSPYMYSDCRNNLNRIYGIKVVKSESFNFVAAVYNDGCFEINEGLDITIIKGSNFIDKIYNVFIANLPIEMSEEELLVIKDMLINIFIPITEEEYESLIGQ